MRKLQSILLVVDCSRMDDDVVDTVIRLATAFGSQVSLLHVVEQTHPALELYRIQKAEEYLEQLSSRIATRHVKVARSTVRSGSPAQIVIDVALEHDVDLIVLGAGEHRNANMDSMGAIAEAVVSHATPPVLAVRPGEPRTLFRRILCPVDQSRTSARGLQNAVRLARAIGSEVCILSVVPDVNWLTAAIETGVLVDARAEHASQWILEFQRFIKNMDLSGIAWKSEVRHGVPHKEIMTAAQEQDSDLIIMGATGRTGVVQLLLGSTTRQLLRGLPCSVLTVKQEDVLEELFEHDRMAIAQSLTEAKTLSDTGAFPEAIKLYRLVLTRDPFHAAAMRELTVLLDKVGESSEADQYRQRLTRLQSGPGRSDIHLTQKEHKNESNDAN